MTRGPSLLLGIELETDGEAGRARDDASGLEHVYALPPVHTRLERLAVRPTYLVSADVVADSRSVEVLRFLLVRGTCEIGTRGVSRSGEARPGDAPAIGRFETDLRTLTLAVSTITGDQPLVYRAAPGGLRPEHVAPLERAGYRIEASVTPYSPSVHRDGVGWLDDTAAPYFLAYDSTVCAGSSTLLEVPCTAGLAGRAADAFRWLHRTAPPAARRVLGALGLGSVVQLRPASTPVGAMNRLAARLAERGAPVLAASITSREAARDGALDRLEAFLRYATSELGAAPLTYREFRSAYLAP